MDIEKKSSWRTNKNSAFVTPSFLIVAIIARIEKLVAMLIVKNIRMQNKNVLNLKNTKGKKCKKIKGLSIQIFHFM